MEENSEAVTSTQKTLLASHDPGWNDPPSWALSQSQNSTGGTPTKRILNKRVAFPLHSKSEPSSSPYNHNLPPIGNVPPLAETGSLTTAPHKPIINPTATQVENSNSEIQINKVQALQDTLDNLNFLIKRLDQSKAEDIQIRLDRMQVMWNEDKLNNTVQKKLLEISEALKANDTEKADRLHISLMMSNASVCGSWIPGIRQLIAEIKNKKDVI